MKPLTPYLFFGGDCRDAMNFYQDCFGDSLEIMTYADGPADACPDACPGGVADKDKIMHACLTAGDLVLMASDNPMGPPLAGDAVSISVHCESVAETERLFAALGRGGTVKMALADTFWGAHFGMLADRFGFHWMLNCPLER
jgi:PhnB protein